MAILYLADSYCTAAAAFCTGHKPAGKYFSDCRSAIAQTNPVQLPQQEQDGLPDNKNALPSNMDQEELNCMSSFQATDRYRNSLLYW